MSLQKIVVTGADGRMGKALIEAVCNSHGVTLAGAVVKEDSDAVGQDAGRLAGLAENGVLVTSDISSVLDQHVTVIDFTAPAATLSYLDAIKHARARAVIGTTGFSYEARASLESYSQSVPLVFAGNYSVGVNLSLQLLRTAAKIMGDVADIEIIEAHHKHKVDAPSGTALMMGEAVADGLNKQLNDIALYERHGLIGPREKGTVGFSTIRGGDVVGDHSVLFLAEGERIEISHRASSRQTFALGAVKAAKWLASCSEGKVYTMEDVLGFS